MDLLLCIIAGITIIIFVLMVNTMHPDSPEQIGTRGEHKVSCVLRNLPENYYVIDDLTIPTRNSTTQIDHVVVSVYGIFVIETKNYSGWIYGSNNTKKWKQCFPSKSNYFYNPIKQNWAHIYALSELLKLDTQTFKPVVVFSDEINDIRKCARKITYEGIEIIMEAFDKAKRRLNANVNFDLAMELLLLTMKEN